MNKSFEHYTAMQFLLQITISCRPAHISKQEWSILSPQEKERETDADLLRSDEGVSLYQWNALSRGQQNEKLKQYGVKKQQEKVEREKLERLEQEKRDFEAKIEEENKIYHIQEQYDRNNVLQCHLKGGHYWWKTWSKYKPVSFSIVRDEVKDVSFSVHRGSGRYKTSQFQARFSKDGLNLYICNDDRCWHGSDFLDIDLRRGKTWKINKGKTFSKMSLRCAYSRFRRSRHY